MPTDTLSILPTDIDHQMMTRALELAQQAAMQDEVPVAAIIYKGDQIIASATNRREQDQDPTAHAEIIAIQKASQALGQWRLLNCTLLVTLEPCPMCAGALVNARVPRLVYGAPDPKMGSVRSLHKLCDDPNFNHQLKIIPNLNAQACGQLLTQFFQEKRKQNKLKKQNAKPTPPTPPTE